VVKAALAVLLALGAGACREPSESGDDGDGDGTTEPDAAPDAFDRIGPCTDEFGDDLTSGFGRFDGIVLAIVPPGYEECPLPNRSHIILEVTAAGSTYRMVTSVKSNIGDPDMFFTTKDAPLEGPTWSEGWHLGVELDYTQTFGLHAGVGFTQEAMPELVESVYAELTLGAKVSVFATVEGQPESAHLVHENGDGIDGAIVVNPDTAPKYLLFHFADQTF
jgi:hypothetical protein